MRELAALDRGLLSDAVSRPTVGAHQASEILLRFGKPLPIRRGFYKIFKNPHGPSGVGFLKYLNSAVGLKIHIPNLNLPQDVMLGIFLLTDPECVLDREEVIFLSSFASFGGLPDSTIEGRGLWRGSDMLQIAFAGLGADFRYERKDVVVERGILRSGRLTKEHVGASEDGIIHTVSRLQHLGPPKALKMLDAFTDLAHAFLRRRPLPLTGEDMWLSVGGAPPPPPVEPSKELVDYVKSAKDPRKTLNSAVVAADDIRVHSLIKNGARNAFTVLVNEAKSKGKPANLTQMWSAVGKMEMVRGRAAPLDPLPTHVLRKPKWYKRIRRQGVQGGGTPPRMENHHRARHWIGHCLCFQWGSGRQTRWAS